MPAATIDSFVVGLLQSQLLSAEQCTEIERLQETMDNACALALEILRRSWLTAYQINQILQGKGSGLTLGPFVLLERVGEGGMGQVFKARQKMLNRVVALKVVRKECLGNPKVILRFQREIRAAGQLSHPHIVRAYDADQVNGTYYIAMEYIDGVDLAKLVKDNGPLPVDQACEYIRQAALGLQHAFERGLVHRDIKPANLLVTKAVSSDRRRSSGLIPRNIDLHVRRSSGMISRCEPTLHYPWGVVKILDMGLARCTDPLTGRASTHLTQLGSLMGTPEFIAPEQARDSHTSDVRADLYSLGCTLYFLLAGQPPFPCGTVTEKLLHHQFDEPEPVARARHAQLVAWNRQSGRSDVDPKLLHVPAPVAAVIRKLMAKSPDERYQTPVELADTLQTIVKQLADGTLPQDSPASTTSSKVAPRAAAAPANAHAGQLCSTVDESVVLLTPKTSSTRKYVGIASLFLAGFGSLALVVVATVIAGVISRHHPGVAAAITAIKPREADEPYWKVALKRAVQKKISWEEARQELLRHRVTDAGTAQAKKIDDLLAKLPTPLDGLERSQFAAVMPSGLPAEVIGLYGLGKPPVVKPVTSLAISQNGRWLAASEDNGVRLFDFLGSVIPFKIPAHNVRVNRIALSPDGWLLASASDDGTVRVWDVASRNRLQSFDKHQKPVTQIAFSPDGTLVASADRDSAIRLWNPRTGAEVRKIDSQLADISVLAFAPDGNDLFWGGAGREIRWTSVKSGAGAVGRFETQSAFQRVLAFHPLGNLVILGGGQGLLHVCIWDGKTLTEKTTFKRHSQVNQVAFAPDGRTFVSVGIEPTAVLWDAEKLQPTKSMNNLRSAGYGAAFAPDGRHFVIGGASNQVFVMRLARHDMDALRAALD
ncbi:MAG: hypothetical protein EXR98_07690 [Gemmataceae bacterium]|nr:hypothetical protein [Gemmataceae bacterium]